MTNFPRLIRSIKREKYYNKLIDSLYLMLEGSSKSKTIFVIDCFDEALSFIENDELLQAQDRISLANYIFNKLEFMSNNSNKLNNIEVKNEIMLKYPDLRRALIDDNDLISRLEKFLNLRIVENILLCELEFLLKSDKFAESELFYKNNKEHINESNYIETVNYYAHIFIDNIIKNKNFLECDKLIDKNRQYFKFDVDVYVFKNKSLLVKEEIERLSQDHNFSRCEVIYESNKEYISESQYYNIVNYYAQEYTETLKIKIHKLLQAHKFTEGDTFFDTNRLYLKESEYERIKAKYIISYFSNNYYEDKKGGYTLDSEQAKTIGVSGQNILITARAGSGKTRVLVSKTLYLLEVEKLKWGSICILAFNKNAKKEITERLQNEIILRENQSKYKKLDIANTFHGLAYKIVKTKVNNILVDKSKFIKNVIESIKESNSKFKSDVYEFFRKDSLTIDKTNFKDPSNYYSYLRNKRYTTLQGDEVKSQGEKWIADFLYEHGVEYKYEKPFFLSKLNPINLSKNEDEAKKITKLLEGVNKTIPDFYLLKYNIVWEHWGIDENDKSNKIEFEKIFANTTWEQYHEKMKWKRKFWSGWLKNRIKPSSAWTLKDLREVSGLIETTIRDTKEGRSKFENKLEGILRDHKIQYEKKNKLN